MNSVCLYSWEACPGSLHPGTPCGVVNSTQADIQKPLHCVRGLRCARLSLFYRVSVAPTARARLASRRANYGTLADYQLLGTKKHRKAYFLTGYSALQLSSFSAGYICSTMDILSLFSLLRPTGRPKSTFCTIWPYCLYLFIERTAKYVKVRFIWVSTRPALSLENILLRGIPYPARKQAVILP